LLDDIGIIAYHHKKGNVPDEPLLPVYGTGKKENISKNQVA
jgi:hypothetical protein